MLKHKKGQTYFVCPVLFTLDIAVLAAALPLIL
jgi:hypothetical protein